jgi:hypothetical protein
MLHKQAMFSSRRLNRTLIGQHAFAYIISVNSDSNCAKKPHVSTGQRERARNTASRLPQPVRERNVTAHGFTVNQFEGRLNPSDRTQMVEPGQDKIIWLTPSGRPSDSGNSRSAKPSRMFAGKHRQIADNLAVNLF